jgi:hypothetical protein
MLYLVYGWKVLVGILGHRIFASEFGWGMSYEERVRYWLDAMVNWYWDGLGLLNGLLLS